MAEAATPEVESSSAEAVAATPENPGLEAPLAADERRELVGAMGGTVGIERAPTTGSRFIVTLPA